MSTKNLIFYDKPKLNKPYLIAGFEGWPDAGQVSSKAVSYLRDKLAAEKLADFVPDDFYLFQSPATETRRPIVDIQDGQIRELGLPATEVWFHKSETAARDLIILLGQEPELRWNDYANLIWKVAHNFGVSRIYALGGTYDVIPHTIGPMVAAVLSQPELEAEMQHYGIRLINYRGPSSVHTMLLAGAGQQEIEVVSLWGYVPHYIQAPNASVCYHMLEKLTQMLGLALDLAELKEESERLDRIVSEAVAQKSELTEYVRQLEADYDAGNTEAPGTLRKEQEDVLKEIEDFLKKRGNES